MNFLFSSIIEKNLELKKNQSDFAIYISTVQEE